VSAPADLVDLLYRHERARVLATLIRVLRDFDLAEEVAQDAFAAALEQWPREGVPPEPRAWLLTTARHKAIDRIRRRVKLREKQAELEVLALVEAELPADAAHAGAVADDRLRLIFTCCHPALPLEGQVALTLRTVAGLSTEEIAAAFFLPIPTMAQRLVRAKGKIRDAGIPYRVPDDDVLVERLEAVMAVVYLVFTEGYAATSGDVVVRRDLCAEAIRLGRLLGELVPGRAEVPALLGLMLLQDSRRDARVDERGDIVLLDEQERSRWDAAEIAEGVALVEGALRSGPAGSPGPYAVQGAIAALHAQAPSKDATDWPQIAGLYAVLARVAPSPMVELNRAVAVAMADGPAAALPLLDGLEEQGDLAGHHLLHAARAELLARLGRRDESRTAYDRAIAAVGNEPERRLLRRKLAALKAKGAT
jgi:RNA polymerase sigma-70 factor, ECF subfamily